MYYAHSRPNRPETEWHSLADHLCHTAELASKFGASAGVSRAATLAGLLHDLGKFTPAFQARLRDATIRAEHSTAGAWQVDKLTSGRDQIYAAPLIAQAIAGHHAGLPDMERAESSLAQRLKSFDPHDLDSVWQQYLSPETNDLIPPLDFGDKSTGAFRFSVFGRMVFSCLVDADFKDTEAFYDAAEGRTSDREWSRLQTLLPHLIPALERYIQDLPQRHTKLNRLRHEILVHIRSHAGNTPGLFTFTVPTGGGKTLASLAFALDHASAHDLDRILYVAPFTAVIDQTAEIFKAILGDQTVLEHHSAIEDHTPQERQSRDKRKLAMEDWAAPVVVTTNVQLFESLFAARTSRCRKLHNIARSVIILDEAQTLPRNLMGPCMAMMDALAANFGCTIVLCTATQPALDVRHFNPVRGRQLGLKLEGRELAPDPARLARELKRVTIHMVGEMSNSDLLADLAEEKQGLVIVNSRRHALALYEDGKAAGFDGLVHLTTRQYAAHRKQILKDIRQRLETGAPCRVIATSLVEAGVDLNFPRVWRAEAGLDQIAQAAGRCNREGLRSLDDSLVKVFGTPDYPPPAEIRGLMGDMSRMVQQHDDLLSPAAMQNYFKEVYWRLGDKLDREDIVGLFRVDQTGPDFAYRTAAEQFQMIESGLAPVIIARDGPARAATDDLKEEKISSGTLARRLQTYIVPVPPKARDLLIANDHVAYRHANLRGEQFAVLDNMDLYTAETGLLWENADYLGMESLIWS